MNAMVVCCMIILVIIFLGIVWVYTNSISFSVQSVSGAIEVISGREGTFRVRCTSTGGRTLSMTVDGPGYSSEGPGGQMIVEPVGVPLGEGNDTYTATTSIISGGSDRDIYQCTASNGVASDPTNTVELRGTSEIM